MCCWNIFERKANKMAARSSPGCFAALLLGCSWCWDIASKDISILNRNVSSPSPLAATLLFFPADVYRAKSSMYTYLVLLLLYQVPGISNIEIVPTCFFLLLFFLSCFSVRYRARMRCNYVWNTFSTANFILRTTRKIQALHLKKKRGCSSTNEIKLSTPLTLQPCFWDETITGDYSK